MNSCFSNREIEELGSSLIQRFWGSQWHSTFVDIEKFIKETLGLSIEYHSFAEDDRNKIGFISDGITPLRIWENSHEVSYVFPKGTIIVDSYLLNPGETGRLRFTLAHEAGHYILDKTLDAAAFHNSFDCERSYTAQDFLSLLSIQETQVDRLAAVLLMPGFLVHSLYQKIVGNDKIPLYGNNLLRIQDKLLVRNMANQMGVSYTACYIRLKELGFFERRDISEYLALEIGL